LGSFIAALRNWAFALDRVLFLGLVFLAPERMVEINGSCGQLGAVVSPSDVVPGEQPATPDPTLIQLIASNAVLVEEHMQLALPFSFTI
jgi:hypothetical protein